MKKRLPCAAQVLYLLSVDRAELPMRELSSNIAMLKNQISRDIGWNSSDKSYAQSKQND
jgi:hypothetical protein